MSLFSELKRRNVVRMAVLYVVAGWVILQIADVLFDQLGVPAWAFRLVLGLLVLGFPLALIFSWVFELTPEGVKRTQAVDPGHSAVQQTGQRMNALIVALLVVAIAMLVANRFIPAGLQNRPDQVVAEEMTPSQEMQAGSANSDPSIAVLPFVNMSDDPGNAYFSDGLSEELLNTLVKVGGLQVTGRTSSFAFKDKNLDLREIGEILNVSNVLEGSVRKAGNRVRITAQLIKTSDGFHLWSDTFDRELNDIFAIQQEIAEKVTNALHVALLGDAEPGPAEPTTTVWAPEAYEEFLRGMYIWQREPDFLSSLQQAQAHFEEALIREPNYVDAYWGLFLVWDRMNRNGFESFAGALEEMRPYASEMQRLAPGSDHALMAASRLALLDYQPAKSLEYLEGAAERFPGNSEVLVAYASSLTISGRYAQAMAVLGEAERLDPLSLELMRSKTFTAYRMGDCKVTEETMNRALELSPDAGRYRYYLAMCIFETLGDAARALPYAESESLDWAEYTGKAILYFHLGEQTKAEEAAAALFTTNEDSAAYQYAQIYAQWGETEKALHWLERAIEIRDPGIHQANDDRLLMPLRNEPRFKRILKQAGF